MKKDLFILIIGGLYLGGCAAASQRKMQSADVVGATETAQDVKTAVGAIADSFNSEGRRIKYCPVCGKHYSPRLAKCPADGTLLRESED